MSVCNGGHICQKTWHIWLILVACSGSGKLDHTLAQTQQAADSSSTQERSKEPGNWAHTSFSQEKKNKTLQSSSSPHLSCAVRMLQLSASASDERERELAATAATIFSSLFCYWCIYTWFLLTIMRIILTNHKENRPFRIQFILTKRLRKITLFLSMLNYSSFSLILIKFLRVGIFSKKNSFHWQKKATQINEENVYSI